MEISAELSEEPRGLRAYHIEDRESKIGLCQEQNEFGYHESCLIGSVVLEDTRAAELGRRLSVTAYVHMTALSGCGMSSLFFVADIELGLEGGRPDDITDQASSRVAR